MTTFGRVGSEEAAHRLVQRSHVGCPRAGALRDTQGNPQTCACKQAAYVEPPFSAFQCERVGRRWVRRMFFWAKKLLGYAIAPVPACVALLVGGLIFLLLTRRQKLGKGLLIAAAVLLLLASNKTVSVKLLRPLEAQFEPVPELSAGAPPPARLAACRYVVVLGGGNGNTPGVAALNQLSDPARARLSEAVRLLRVLPEARLVVSGPADGRNASHATKLEQAAMSLGVEQNRIIRIEHARDTEDEAAAARAHIGNAPVALVTSAWHMPRALALFRSAGMDPLPCPTGFIAHADGQFRWRDLMWDVESIERSTLAVRERVGYLWIFLRGRTGNVGAEAKQSPASRRQSS